MTTYTSTFEQDGDDLVLPIPPQIIEALGVKVGEEIDIVWEVRYRTITIRVAR